MTRTFLWASFVGAIGCAGGPDPGETLVEPGAMARESFGIAAYAVTSDARTVSIELLDSADQAIGVIEVGLDGDLIAGHDDPALGLIMPYYRYHARYVTDGADQIVVEGDSHSVMYLGRPEHVWQAVLAEPALAATLAAMGVRFRAGTPPGALDIDLADPEVGYNGEYPCGYGHHGEGHRVGTLGGWIYMGCSSPHNSAWQYPGCIQGAPYNHTIIQGSYRICNGGCCSGNECANPPPGGSPCGAPYGGGGCYVDHNWQQWPPC